VLLEKYFRNMLILLKINLASSSALPHSKAMNALRSKVGGVILAGFDGQDAAAPAIQSLSTLGIRNFILFTRNLGTPDSIRKLIGSLKALPQTALGGSALVAVDQEGGMVSRLQKDSTWFPGAMACAAALEGNGAETPSLADLVLLAHFLGTELLDCGFNVNLAPVADINSNPLNPVIGVRSYGEKPDKVARLVAAVARGFQAAGLQTCAKHFPGHGDTAVDSHFGLPTLGIGLERLNTLELVPFRALIAQGIDSLMTAHVLMPQVVRDLGGSIEEEALPATLNPRILQGLLRGRLGFEGPLLTDCLTMKAIADHFPDAPVQALAAGADLLCISHNLDFQTQACERIEAAVRSRRLPEARLDEALGRVQSWQKSAAERRASQQKPSVTASELSKRFSRASLHLRGSRQALNLENERVLVVDTLPVVLHGADDSLSPRTLSAALETKHNRNPKLAITSVSAAVTKEELERAVQLADHADQIILGLYEAMRNSGQQSLVQALRLTGKPLSFIAMRSPYDAALARPGEAVLLAWEYTPLSVETVVDFLMGSQRAPGGCPVTV